MTSRPPMSSASRRAWLSAGAPILVLVLIVTVLASLLVASFARQQDRGFRTESTRLMESALAERSRAINNQAWDYGNWDDAYIAITGTWDQAWVADNYFSSIADGLMVFRPDGPAIARHLWVADPYTSHAAAIAPALLHAARAAMASGRVPDGERTIHSGQLVINGRLATFSIAPVRMMDGSAPVRDYVVILEIFEPDELTEIGAARDLQDAAFAPGAMPALQHMVALAVGNDASPVGSIVWRDERPGSSAFIGQLWPILLALLSVGALTLLVTRRLVAAYVKNASRTEAALESSRMRAEFISTMSHELRTPLNAIIGYAELIQEEAEDASGQIGVAIQTDAGHVLGAARHLHQLVEDVLDHSRFDAGRIRMNIESLSIEGVIAETFELIEPLARSKRNTLTFQNEAGAFDVLGDDVRLRQCLINLVGNANKFTANGTVSVTARLDSDASRIVFDVADTGIGIDGETIGKLFRPFTQAKSIHTDYGGAGLGLSISRKLARAMGGDITVVSELGRGSTFSLSLRATPQALELAA